MKSMLVVAMKSRLHLECLMPQQQARQGPPFLSIRTSLIWLTGSKLVRQGYEARRKAKPHGLAMEGVELLNHHTHFKNKHPYSTGCQATLSRQKDHAVTTVLPPRTIGLVQQMTLGCMHLLDRLRHTLATRRWADGCHRQV